MKKNIPKTEQTFKKSKPLDHLSVSDGILLMANEQKKAAGAYSPITCDISPKAQMIPGFKEGLKFLKEGDEAFLFIPYQTNHGLK